MALMQKILSCAGPLPAARTLTAESDGNVLLYLSGSAWSETAGAPITIAVYVDNQQIGEITAYTSEATSHKTLVPAFFPLTLSPIQGELHTVQLTTANDGGVTITDKNDNFNVTLSY